MEWQFLRWKGGEVPDYLIDETGPEPVFYCDHDCKNLMEHQQHGDNNLRRIANGN